MTINGLSQLESGSEISATRGTWCFGKTCVNYREKQNIYIFFGFRPCGIEGRKKVGFTLLSSAYRSYHDEIESRNREDIPFPSRKVPRGLSVAEGP